MNVNWINVANFAIQFSYKIIHLLCLRNLCITERSISNSPSMIAYMFSQLLDHVSLVLLCTPGELTIFISMWQLFYVNYLS